MKELDITLTEEEKKENAKKAAAVALAAAIAAGGAAVADSPIDYENIQLPDPVVMDIDDYGATATDDEQKMVQKSSRETISKVLLAPFYAIGAVISWGADVLTAVAATPLGAVLLGWLVTALVILGSLAAALKIAFPDVPLKEMLTKKNILIILGGTAVISGACWAIPQIWPDAGIWVFIFKIAAGIGILVPLYVVISRKVKAIKEKLPHRKEKSEMEYLYYEGRED